MFNKIIGYIIPSLETAINKKSALTLTTWMVWTLPVLPADWMTECWLDCITDWTWTGWLGIVTWTTDIPCEPFSRSPWALPSDISEIETNKLVLSKMMVGWYRTLDQNYCTTYKCHFIMAIWIENSLYLDKHLIIAPCHKWLLKHFQEYRLGKERKLKRTTHTIVDVHHLLKKMFKRSVLYDHLLNIQDIR